MSRFFPENMTRVNKDRAASWGACSVLASSLLIGYFDQSYSLLSIWFIHLFICLLFFHCVGWLVFHRICMEDESYDRKLSWRLIRVVQWSYVICWAIISVVLTLDLQPLDIFVVLLAQLISASLLLPLTFYSSKYTAVMIILIFLPSLIILSFNENLDNKWWFLAMFFLTIMSLIGVSNYLSELHGRQKKKTKKVTAQLFASSENLLALQKEDFRNIEKCQRLKKELNHTNELLLNEKMQNDNIARHKGLLEKQMGELKVRLSEIEAKASEAIITRHAFLENMNNEIQLSMDTMTVALNVIPNDILMENQKELFDRAKLDSSHLVNFLDNMIDYSKIESGILIMSPRTFSMQNFLHSLVISVQELADEKDIVLKINFDEDLPEEIIGESKRLQQALTHLLSNAIRFSERGSTIEFNVAKIERNEKVMIEYSVRDYGIGIPKDRLAVMFNSFSDLYSNRHESRDYKSFGLALTLRLVYLMGGKINIRSLEGQGTTFWFSLPASVEHYFPMPGLKIRDLVEVHGLDECKSEKSYLEESSREEDLSLVLSPCTVLLAEDNLINQKVAMALLERDGHKVEIAENGYEVLQKLKDTDVDLILMDVQMPKMNGLEATHKIREMEEGTSLHIPIIGISANPMNTDRESCLAAGMDEYMSKPIEGHVLRQRMGIVSNLSKE